MTKAIQMLVKGIVIGLHLAEKEATEILEIILGLEYEISLRSVYQIIEDFKVLKIFFKCI